MDQFDLKTSDRLRLTMLASREALKEATDALGNAQSSALTSHENSPSAEQTQAFSQATAAEQRDG